MQVCFIIELINNRCICILSKIFLSRIIENYSFTLKEFDFDNGNETNVQLKSRNLEIKFSSSDDGWTKISYPLFFQGKAEGQRSAVWIRARLQDQLSQLGYFLQRHAGKVLFLAIVALATFCVALKSAQIHSKVEQLWVQGEYVF